jgi:hypothetical protein
MVLGALLLVDLAANIAWTASSGFPTRYVTVDEHRPVRPGHDWRGEKMNWNSVETILHLVSVSNWFCPACFFAVEMLLFVG